jgi:hypothetical protein
MFVTKWKMMYVQEFMYMGMCKLEWIQNYMIGIYNNIFLQCILIVTTTQ